MSLEDLARDAEAVPPARPGQTPQKIRDAATIMLVDDSGSAPKILVGLRGSRHVFMAGKLVFPGGRIDADDLRLAPQFELSDDCRRRLLGRTRSAFSARRATALALAGIRETFEETGVMLGRREAFSSTFRYWTDFAAAGIRPDPTVLVPIARAITPPGRTRRYDTRFLAARHEAIASSVPFDQRPTDEFDRVEWITIEDMLEQDLATITRQVLGDLVTRIERGTLGDPTVPIPFYRTLNRRMRREFV